MKNNQKPLILTIFSVFQQISRKIIIWNRDFDINDDELPQHNLHHLKELTLSFRMMKESSSNSSPGDFDESFSET